MKHTLLLLISLAVIATAAAQDKPLKKRPDAFPPAIADISPKAVSMASSVNEMAAWDRYPTYDTYLDMMEQWSANYPDICRVDTIGTSINGRLILCMAIHSHDSVASNNENPEFFYSSSMHGDELTGFIMMLRLIDTLLSAYGVDQHYTDIVNSVDIYINPLANPDGTYRQGNQSVQGAVRYNANNVDLNRNFPDPFGTDPLDTQQPENTAMIDFVSRHRFRLSANLHGGSEVMNYPWDSFTSSERPHPDRDWWIDVCRRFIDTSRTFSSSHFRDVIQSGYIEGGDWYVIPNGRQDYINFYHDCRELTMEISTVKTIPSNQLPEYWRFLQHSLVNYIEEIHTFSSSTSTIDAPTQNARRSLEVHPNPTHDKVFLSQPPQQPVTVLDMQGRTIMVCPAGVQTIDLQRLPRGLYLLRSGTATAKVVRL